jgi:hypothetical protein
LKQFLIWEANPLVYEFKGCLHCYEKRMYIEEDIIIVHSRHISTVRWYSHCSY